MNSNFLYSYGDVLSAQEKFILVYVLSHPVGWEFKINDLRKHITDGERTIRSAIKNLVANGFISRVRDEKMYCHYHFFDDPKKNLIKDYLLGDIQDENFKKLYKIDRKKVCHDSKD